MILEILGDKRPETHHAKQEEDGGERVEEVDLVPQESLATVDSFPDIVPGGLRLLELLLLHPLGLGVLLSGEPFREEGEEGGEDEGDGGDDDESEPPGAQPAALSLLQAARPTWDNIHL